MTLHQTWPWESRHDSKVVVMHLGEEYYKVKSARSCTVGLLDVTAIPGKAPRSQIK